MLEIGAIVWGVRDLQRAIRFWSEALDYKLSREPDVDFAILIPKQGEGIQLSLNAAVTSAKPKRHHMDLFTHDQEKEVDRLLNLGAKRVDWKYEPGADYVVLADPDENTFCVVLVHHKMRLVPITADDEDLAVRLECDPEMMRHIGGPRPEVDVRASHKRRLDLMEKGEAHMYKIVAENSNEVLGTIGIWKIDWKGPQAYEMGWFVLPEHQGKGVATEAVRLIITQARSDPEVRYIHAYPAVTNTASNAIARKIGMENQGEFDNEGFAGIIRCNDWRINIR